MTNHVTLVVKHKLRAGKEVEYENWLTQVMPIAEAHEGYIGINVLRPTDDSNIYTVLVRVTDADNLNQWLASNERKQMIKHVSTMLADNERQQIKPSAELWFSPAAAQQKAVPK